MRVSVMGVWLILLASSTAAGTSTNPKVAATIAQQRNAATPRTHFIPFYSLLDGDETDLFFVSKVTDPLLIDVYATSPAGVRLYLGRETLAPSRNLSIHLRDRLGSAGGAFASGNLRFDFVGDAGALQAWAVVRSGRQSFEIPFIPSDKIAVNELLSYWDTATAGPRPKLSIEYRLTNTTTSPVDYVLTRSRGTRIARSDSGILAPLGTRTLTVTDGETTHQGWLRLTHGGPPGAVIGAGIVTAEKRLAYLPLVTVDAMRKGPVFEILRIPQGAEKGGKRLTLFNPSDGVQNITIEAVAESNGAIVATGQLSLKAWEVGALDVDKSLRGVVQPGIRLRVRGSAPTLMVDGVVITAAGEVLDVSVHAASSAHKSGTYPIPDLDRYAVRTTIINLGTEESEIAAQYFWDGGTFAAPLMLIPPGGTAVLDPSEFAADETQDALGRKLSYDGKHLSLKWGVRRGSKELIGRTEARPRDGADGVGFNCGGCCWSIPEGGIEPQEVEIAPGDSVNFAAVVSYWTCSGPLGPWTTGGTTSSVPWPFSWQSWSSLTTVDGADADIGWSGSAEQTDYLCLVTSEPVAGGGTAKGCKKTFNPNGYNKNLPCVEQTNNQSLTTQQRCANCVGCCQALYNWQVCEGASAAALERELEDCTNRCVNEMNCP